MLETSTTAPSAGAADCALPLNDLARNTPNVAGRVGPRYLGDLPMFETIQTAPPDAILGLTEAFNADPNPEKINLSVGVFRDAGGGTPILEVVREAEQKLLAKETSKSYRPIPGDPAYGACVRSLLFGAKNTELSSSGRAVTAHCPGGTGALRVAGDYLARNHPGTRVWLSTPTWANHQAIFTAAGLEIQNYPYFDKATNGLNFEAMLEALNGVQAGDVVLLHGCCHNPTGVDPSLEQWEALAKVLKTHQAIPLIDFAYQGFGDGVDEDAAGLRKIFDHLDEGFICSSFSKNFGLYCERTGALTVVTSQPAHAQAVFSQIKRCIRSNYSNPPAHGAAIVQLILSDPELKSSWEQEVTSMRNRIKEMRSTFVKNLAEAGVAGDFSFIEHQRGMFSFSGLNPDQVKTLRETHSVYVVGSGRINVAGMTNANIPRLCQAIKAVVD